MLISGLVTLGPTIGREVNQKVLPLTFLDHDLKVVFVFIWVALTKDHILDLLFTLIQKTRVPS